MESSLPLTRTLGTIAERSVETFHAWRERLGNDIGHLAASGEVMYLHDPLGLTADDFHRFAHPDDSRSKAALTTLRRYTFDFARGQKAIIRQEADGHFRFFISRDTVELYIKELQTSGLTYEQQRAATLQFILDHTSADDGPRT
jgi:hypothetical protein